MELQQFATPAQETPQQRYAALHRAVERGLASAEVMRELAEVCLDLGNASEAVQTWRQMPAGAHRNAIGSTLHRRELITDAELDADGGQHPSPGAALAAPGGPNRTPILLDHVFDAVEFLFTQHMPWIALATTLAFPLVVGLGGFLSAGASPMLLAGIATLPGLCVLAIVGAMGRRIFLESSHGSAETPPLPDFPGLVADTSRFLGDSLLVAAMLLGPGIAFAVNGVPLAVLLPLLALGAFFVPMALALRQLRNDFASLSPTVLLRAVGRCGGDYAGLAGAFWSLFVPAGVACWLVGGRAAWLQIAVVGPLTVVPLFVASRLLGTWIDAQRLALGAVLLSRQQEKDLAEAMAAPVVPTLVDESADQAQAQTPCFPARPPEIAHFGGPGQAPQRHPLMPTVPQRKKAPAAAPKAAPKAAPAARTAKRIEGRAPARPATTPAHPAAPTAPAPKAPAAKPAPVAQPVAQPTAPAKASGKPAAPVRAPSHSPSHAPAPAMAAKGPAPAPAASPVRAPAGKPTAAPAAPAAPAARPQAKATPAEPRPAAPGLSDGPDLSHLPGAQVFTGQERHRFGASTRRE